MKNRNISAMNGPILTFHVSYDEFLLKDVPFKGQSVDTKPI